MDRDANRIYIQFIMFSTNEGLGYVILTHRIEL